MCLAIYKPAGATVAESHLRNGFANHSDGAGFAWAADGALHVVKGLFDVEEVVKQYELIKEYPCLIHFRKATHGTVDESNCHPFLFNDGKLALIHNGIISIKCTIEGLSDTAHFVKLVLEPMVKRNNVPINDGALQYLISTSIGTDKMVIMDGDGKAYVINEDKGKWEGGVWYSNTSFSWSYKTPVVTPTTPYQYPQQSQSSYLTRYNTGHAPNSSTGKTWRKSFETDSEDDASYLEFWKRTKDVKTDIGSDISNKETQVLPNIGFTTTEVIDDAGNVTIIDVHDLEETQVEDKKTFGEGMMCEYGWWDEEIESDIALLRLNMGLNRETAILRVFSER